jgi:hypothetical protein
MITEQEIKDNIIVTLYSAGCDEAQIYNKTICKFNQTI